MKTLIVTDIHLGHPFLSRTAEDKAIKLIKETDADQIILGGDIVELTMFPNDPQRALTASENFANAIKDAIARGIKVVFVRGNHDRNIQFLRGNPFPKYIYTDKYVFKDNNKTILFRHGHEYDPPNKGKGLIGRLFTAMYAVIVLLFNWNPQRFLVEDWSLSANITKRLLRRQRKKAIKDNKGYCDIFIWGHTHVQELIVKKNFVIANAGSIYWDQTYIELIDGVVFLRKL